MAVSVLLKNVCPTIGEGPHWHENKQSLLFLDIYSGTVHDFNTVTGEQRKITLGEIPGSPATNTTVGFVVPRTSGGYVVGTNTFLSILDWNSAQLTPMCSVQSDERVRFNDGKCDSSGRLWAGTMGPEKEPGKPIPDLGSLYSLELDRNLVNRFSPISISNGLTWSKDNRSMFYIDSAPKQIYKFDYDLTSGGISNKRVLADWSGSDDMGFPDGMTIDQEGKLWVACFLGAKVVQLDPETGTLLRQVDFPAKRITSCCFGGADYQDLFVTSSRFGVSEEEQAVYPLAGSVFKVTGLGVKGTPSMEYGG